MSGGGDTPSPTPVDAHYKTFSVSERDYNCLCDQNGILAIVKDRATEGALIRDSDAEYRWNRSIPMNYTGEKITIASLSSGLESFEWGGVVFTYSGQSMFEVNPAPTSL